MPQGHGYGEAREPLVWERVEWRQGDGRYVFELIRGGLHARLTAPGGSALTLPVVAWEGLLDAVSASRKTRTRGESRFPARSGARWYDGETGELATAFKAGRSVAQLARVHNRSQLAVEAELDRLGLWDRVERRPKLDADREPHSHQAPEVGRFPSRRGAVGDPGPAGGVADERED